jgi:hypothetical protein
MTSAGERGQDTSAALGVVDAGTLVLRDDSVLFAIEVLDRSGVVLQLEAWRLEERERLGHHAGGAPERFPAKAVWVAMTLAAIHNLPMLATEFCNILFLRISPAMRQQLGVPEPPAREDRLGCRAVYRCVRTRFHSLLESIDPSDLPKNRLLAADDFAAAVTRNRIANQLTDDVLAARRDRLTWVVNAIIEASWSLVPRDMRRDWDGSVGLDATAVRAFARSDVRVRGKGSRAKRRLVEHSSDPDGGLYTRTQPRDDGATGLREAMWAFEASFAVAGNGDPAKAAAFPPLVAGMAPLHRPGTGVGRNAITALASVAERGHPTGWLAADRAYTNTIPEDFQLPARALGYEPVLDYRVDQLGVHGSYAGALLIEGAWYCPMVPAPLKNATIDYRAGRIDEATWHARIEARRAYRTRPKANPDAEGHQRDLCPASDRAPTAGCELKPRSIKQTTSATTRIPVTDELRSNPAKICQQQSVTFPPDAGAKLRQTLHYGSPEWAAIYHTLRNTIEGMNGIAKDGAYAALGDPSRRRIRGVAAQSIFVALLFFAINVRAIRSFRERAVPHSDGVPRRHRRRRRTSRSISDWAPTVNARSGAPPP